MWDGRVIQTYNQSESVINSLLCIIHKGISNISWTTSNLEVPIYQNPDLLK